MKHLEIEKIKLIIETSPLLQKLIQNLFSNKINFELIIDKTTGCGKIGINNEKTHTWYWFFIIGDTETLFYFQHSYNQSTGKTNKSNLHGRKFAEKFNKLIGENILMN